MIIKWTFPTNATNVNASSRERENDIFSVFFSLDEFILPPYDIDDDACHSVCLNAF